MRSFSPLLISRGVLAAIAAAAVEAVPLQTLLRLFGCHHSPWLVTVGGFIPPLTSGDVLAAIAAAAAIAAVAVQALPLHAASPPQLPPHTSGLVTVGSFSPLLISPLDAISASDVKAPPLAV